MHIMASNSKMQICCCICQQNVHCSHCSAFWEWLINVYVSLAGVSGPLRSPGAHVLSGHPEWTEFHLLLRAGLSVFKRVWTWRTLHPSDSSPTANCTVLQKTLTVENTRTSMFIEDLSTSFCFLWLVNSAGSETEEFSLGRSSTETQARGPADSLKQDWSQQRGNYQTLCPSEGSILTNEMFAKRHRRIKWSSMPTKSMGWRNNFKCWLCKCS